jgi:hypothetical protein
MGLFEKFDLERMIEKALEHINMEEITAQVMADLKITDLDMYFVVKNVDGDPEDYDFVGMAYSIESARELQDTVQFSEILKLNMMRMVPLAKSMGYVEEVS